MTMTKTRAFSEGDLCYQGRHLLTEENIVRFPGSGQIACRSCEIWYCLNKPDLFWAYKESNLNRRADPPGVWVARCERYMEMLGITY